LVNIRMTRPGVAALPAYTLSTALVQGIDSAALSGSDTAATPASQRLDPYLELRNSSGLLLRSDDDSAGDRNSEISSYRLPATGVYTIVARDYTHYETGRFTLALRQNRLLYDFIEAAPNAQWYGTNTSLIWPGAGTDEAGFARWMSNAQLEDGSRRVRLLETHPTWTENGVIMAEFPTSHLQLQEGDHFVAEVGLLAGAEAGDVTFSVRIDDGDPDSSYAADLATVTDRYDGLLQPIDVDLSQHAGRSGIIILRVSANGAATQDWAVWIDARLEHR
jgi:hypothetical protein